MSTTDGLFDERVEFPLPSSVHPEPVEGPTHPERAEALAPSVSKDPLAELAQLWRSPAIPSFIARRIDQVVKHGHSPEADLTAPTDRLVRAAKDRICAALDKLGGIGGAGDDLPYALAKIEIAGACLMAAHDQLSAIKAARG